MALYASERLHPVKWKRIDSYKNAVAALKNPKYKTFSFGRSIEQKNDTLDILANLIKRAEKRKDFKIASTIYLHDIKDKHLGKIINSLYKLCVAAKSKNPKFQLKVIIDNKSKICS